ncbi:hypothetical protein [Kitasatospora aureofaciens]|uniref:hypothetical protein n=1 Tax=Kitasatospora aureofaciens TaxID=1894 RepID=UPI001C44225E|nr:hypothetical protein [Kitasatospora aureofaciens]MBV6697591.1 hypothetical protein [Kitasatospora aureofaciens]
MTHAPTLVAAQRVVAVGGALTVPYIAVKTYWASGGRAGLSDGYDLAGEFTKNGAPDALVWLERHGVDFTAVLALTGLIAASTLVRPWARRLPRRLLLVPACAATLLVSYGLLTAVTAISEDGGHAETPITGWIVPAGVCAFLGIGTALGAGAWSRLYRRTGAD